eukprot:6097730-Prorocentrum_lima.AAC.1
MEELFGEPVKGAAMLSLDSMSGQAQEGEGPPQRSRVSATKANSSAGDDEIEFGLHALGMQL